MPIGMAFIRALNENTTPVVTKSVTGRGIFAYT